MKTRARLENIITNIAHMGCLGRRSRAHLKVDRRCVAIGRQTHELRTTSSPRFLTTGSRAMARFAFCGATVAARAEIELMGRSMNLWVMQGRVFILRRIWQ